MRISLAFLFFIFLTCAVQSQTSSEDSALSPEQMQEDLDSIQSIILNTPTHPFAFIEAQDFFSHLQHIRDSIQVPRTVIEFYKLLNPLVVRLRDIHSRIWLSSKYNPYLQNGGLYLPFSIKYFDNKVYIISDSDSLIIPGSELIAINGIPALWIMRRLLDEHYTDGYIYNTRVDLTEENFANLYPLYYHVDSLNSLQIRSYGARRDTLIQYPGRPRTANGKVKKRKRKFRDVYSLSILPEDSLAILKVSSFARGNEWRYRNFLKKSFRQINQTNTKNLVIDIRGNKGGYIIRGPRLLSYIARDSFAYAYKSIVKSSSLFKQRIKYDMIAPGVVIPLFKRYIGRELISGWKNPTGTYDTLKWDLSPPTQAHKQFRGTTFLLTDGLSISNSCLFHHAFSSNQLGQTIGNTCGCISNGTFGNSVEFLLPNSKITGRISTIRITSSPKDHHFPEEGKAPDFLVPTSLEDILNDRDPQLEFILKKIRENP